MPNHKGGKGYKRAKKTSFEAPTFEIAQDGQYYARIVKNNGDKRFDIVLHGKVEKVKGRVRGSLKGGLKKDDIVLVSDRDFRNNAGETFVQDVYDIISFYSRDQVKKLRKMGQINDPSFEGADSSYDAYGGDIDFENGEEDDEIEPQREYDMPSSESEDEEDFDVEKI